MGRLVAHRCGARASHGCRVPLCGTPARPPFATPLVVATFGASAFVLAAAAVKTDFRDADGFVDCWPACTALQKTIPLGLFVAPVVSVLAPLTAIVAVARRGRSPDAKAS
jgi:hypothetical protein